MITIPPFHKKYFPSAGIVERGLELVAKCAVQNERKLLQMLVQSYIKYSI